MQSQLVRLVGVLLLANLVALATGQALADECGSGPRYANAPKGAIVVSRSDGVVATIMDHLGEYYTHSAIARPGRDTDWFLHSTLDGVDMCGLLNIRICDDDISHNANPGPSRVNGGAYYSFLHANTLFAAKWGRQNPTQAKAIANWMFAGNTDGWSKHAKGDGLFEYSYHGIDLNYRLEEYTKSRANIGGLRGAGSDKQGLVCSTYIAYANAKANDVSWQLSEKTYSRSLVCSAVGLVRSAIKDLCEDELNWFTGLFASCADSADMVTNCFLDVNECGNTSKWWQDNCRRAKSVSPDRLVGRDSNNGGGPYENVVLYNLSWSGSNIYGCWEK